MSNATQLLHSIPVDKVYHPGWHSHPNQLIAKNQSRELGGTVSFSLKEDTEAAAVSFVTSTKYFFLAESLGGLRSVLSHPANMTHKSIPAHNRSLNGLADSHIRLGVGLEEAEDLVAELEQVFYQLQPAVCLKPALAF